MECVSLSHVCWICNKTFLIKGQRLQRKSIESLHTAQRMRVQRYGVLSPSCHREQYIKRTMAEVQASKSITASRDDGEVQPELNASMQTNASQGNPESGASQRSAADPREGGMHPPAQNN